MRVRLSRMRILVAAVLALTGCGAPAPRVSAPAGAPERSVDEWAAIWRESRPDSYVFDLEASCGERSLLGRFRVWVDEDGVRRFRPLDGTPADHLTVDDLPTVDDLYALAGTAPPAEVELTIGADGVPVEVSVDHLPEAIDDEECYRVSAFGPD